MNKQLKPCPFCGSNKIDVGWYDYGSLKCIYLYHCYCDDCLSKTKELHTEQEAIEAWNTRPEKPQSAWELLHYLVREHTLKKVSRLIKKRTYPKKHYRLVDWTSAIINFCTNKSEQQAIEILTKIKKELE